MTLNRDWYISKLRLEREKLRRLYRTDLFAFARDCLGYDWLEREVHGKLCRRMEARYWGLPGAVEHVKGGVRGYIDLMPRYTLKTTIKTYSFPIWVWCQNDPPGAIDDPDRRPWEPPASFNGKRGYDQTFLLGQEVETNVREMLEAIKNQLSRNHLLQELFGNLAPDKRGTQTWTTQAIDVALRQDFKNRAPNLAICSLESGLNSKHVDYILLDDIFSNNQMTNEVQIRKVFEFIRLMYPIVEKPGILDMTGTRWDDKDPYGVFSREEADQWDIYVESGERTEAEIAAGERPYFWPNRLGPDVIAQLKTKMRPYLFSCQINNRPIDQETALFKKEHFEGQYYQLPAGKHLTEFLADKAIFTTIDPAISEGDDACYTAMLTCGWGADDSVYVLDAFYKKGVQPDELLEECFRVQETWHPVFMGVEERGFQKMIRINAERESKNRGVWINWFEIKDSGRSKPLRILGLNPIVSKKRLFLRPEHSFIEDEALRYPRGQYQDALDALAYQIDMAYNPAVSRPKAKESPAYRPVQRNEITEMFERRFRALHGGQSVKNTDWYHA